MSRNNREALSRAVRYSSWELLSSPPGDETYSVVLVGDLTWLTLVVRILARGGLAGGASPGSMTLGVSKAKRSEPNMMLSHFFFFFFFSLSPTSGFLEQSTSFG
jgi:hypothetical protein